MLLIALAGTVVVRHNTVALCAVWLSTAAIFLAATRTAGTRRP